MAMIYALIIKEKKGFYGNTDYRKAGEAIFRFEAAF
jgi:hypothetical protein